MESYDKRRTEYTERLLQNLDLVKSLIDDKEGEEKTRFANILFAPCNELELRYAYAFIQSAVDFKNFKMKLQFDLIEEIPLEENEGIKWIVKIVKNATDVESLNLCFDEEPPEEMAKILFGLFGALVGNQEEAYKQIAIQLGYDPDNEEETDKLNELLEGVKDTLETATQLHQPSITENLTEKNVSDFEKFTECFHNLCEEHDLDKEDNLGTYIKLLSLFRK